VKCEKKSGVDKELDFLQSTPMGDMVILYFESKDIKKVFETFATSKDPFDLRMKEELKKITDIDFNQPSGPLPELMLTYKKQFTGIQLHREAEGES
jgi:hypothetical protein